MRHPLLRILVALLIGVVTPLCCCQAMALAGSLCNGRQAAATELGSCCHECPLDPASDQRQTPTDDQPPLPGECPSCPSCQGTSGGTGAKSEASLPAFEQQWHASAMVAIAVVWNFSNPGPEATPSQPRWTADPPHLKANREALRWHCALLV